MISDDRWQGLGYLSAGSKGPTSAVAAELKNAQPLILEQQTSELQVDVGAARSSDSFSQSVMREKRMHGSCDQRKIENWESIRHQNTEEWYLVEISRANKLSLSLRLKGFCRQRHTQYKPLF